MRKRVHSNRFGVLDITLFDDFLWELHTMMSEAQEKRHFEKVCQALASHIVPRTERQALKSAPELKHLTSRFSTFHIMLDEATEDFVNSPSPSRAVALINADDFVWQIIRKFGERQGIDADWLLSFLPVDHEAIDGDIEDDYFALQKQIIADFKWVYDLHTALRHPNKQNGDLLKCFRHPVDDRLSQRLLRAATAVRQVLVCVQVDLDPTVTVQSEHLW